MLEQSGQPYLSWIEPRTQTPVRHGGSVKDGIIVIQCSIVIPLLQKRGYTVKRTGG